MKEIKGQYVKRTQKDYSLSFKLAVVQEVGSGAIGIKAAMRKYGIQGNNTITTWRQKYGIFDIDNRSQIKAMQTPQQKIKELEQRVSNLQREKAFLEQRLMETQDKADILDKVIELAEQEYLLPLRKNFFPGQSKSQVVKQAKR